MSDSNTVASSIRWVLPLLPAALVAWWVVVAWRKQRRPPGLESALGSGSVMLLLGLFFYLGAFGSVAMIGLPPPEPPSQSWMLFTFQIFSVGCLLLCFLIAYGVPNPGDGRSSRPGWAPWRELVRSCGLRARRPLDEIALGTVSGFGAWLFTMLVMAALLVIVRSLWGEGALPQSPPELVLAMAAQPLGVRIALAVTAGVVEETFFRGFLQPRIGIAASTALFALGHVPYGSLPLLVGVVLLSLIFAWLTKARGNIWAAVIAHAIFDAIQLLWLLPQAGLGDIPT